MRATFFDFFSRFRRKGQVDPIKPRTMAESQLEDQQGQNPNSEERKVFDEKSFEKGQDALHKPFGTSSHGGDNPLRDS